MSCRRLPQYHSDRGWILGVALASMLALIRSALRGFTCVRCCSMPPASSPHALAGSCSCLWLTVASNRFCKGLAPSIDHSCSTYSPGLRPEKQHGVAPALLRRKCSLYSPALGEHCCQQLQTRIQPARLPIPKEYFSNQAGIFSFQDFPDVLPINRDRGSLLSMKADTPLETAWGKSKSGLLSCVSKRSMRRPNTTVRDQENLISPSHFPSFVPLYK
jgi:hypothetical protein